jgi:hypothetical protein
MSPGLIRVNVRGGQVVARSLLARGMYSMKRYCRSHRRNAEIAEHAESLSNVSLRTLRTIVFSETDWGDLSESGATTSSRHPARDRGGSPYSGCPAGYQRNVAACNVVTLQGRYVNTARAAALKKVGGSGPLAVQFCRQPRLGEPPVTLDGFSGDAQRHGSLVDAQAHEDA